MNTDLMFSSKTGKWDTPDDLIADLATVFDWDCDVCAERPNVCSFIMTKATMVWRNLGMILIGAILHMGEVIMDVSPG